jgi:hypothetical protein
MSISHAAPFAILRDDDVKVIHVLVCAPGTDPDDHWASVQRRALAAGHTILHHNGVRVWRTTSAVAGPGTEGSARYLWHEDGDRIRAERIEHTLMPGEAQAQRRVLRRVWTRFI